MVELDRVLDDFSRVAKARVGIGGRRCHASRLPRRSGSANLTAPTPAFFLLVPCRTGSRLAKTGRCSPSQACGGPGRARAAPRRTRSRGAHELFAFLTCESNAVVAPIHPKAMPVILTHARGMRHLAHGADHRGTPVAASACGRAVVGRRQG